MILERIRKSPLSWVSSLYFVEGVPYVLVMSIALIFYHDVGLSNTNAALLTSWLYLPWVIKPFWSPFVDMFKSKRWWILVMQTLLAVLMGGVVFALNLPNFVTWTLIIFWLMAFSSATHDVAADGFYMLALNESQQSFYVGIRSTFYRISTIVTQGGLLFCVSYLQENLQLATYDSWKWIFIAVAGLFLLLMLYHKFVLPCPSDDGTNEESRYHFLEGYFKIFIEFFKKESIVISILFLLLYRLPEALLVKICPLFFLDEVANGGLGLSKGELGFIQGTVGVIGLLIGGILGGWMVSKHGLKKSLWPMVFAISIPDALYLIMAYFQNASLLFVSASVFVEQLGYGFGFTAYMLYMIYISQGKYKTAYYAFCTGFMALSMMLPGLFAGWLQEILGYKDFFIMVCASTSFTFLSAMIIKLDRDFGKEQ